MERDILLERLERKLAEKEKEVEELRRMLSSKSFEELKREISEELKKELKTIEAKVLEISKTVETLMSEVLYIKSELKKYEKKETEIVDIAGESENVEPENSEDVVIAEEIPEKKKEEKNPWVEEDIIIVD